MALSTQSSPRLFNERGIFLRLAPELEAALERNAPEKHAKYAALRDAALACEETEAAVKALESELAEARKEFQAAIKARDAAYPKTTPLSLSKQYARDSLLRRAVAHGAVSPDVLRPASPAPSTGHGEAQGISLSQHNQTIKEADQKVASLLAELQAARYDVKAARKKVAEAWVQHQAQWPTLSPEENARQYRESQQLKRARDPNRNAVGDSYETQLFVAKQQRFGGNRHGSVGIETLMRMKADARRRKLESQS